MKTTVLFRVMVLITVMVAGMANSNVMAQKNNFITNDEVENNQVVSRTIYKNNDGLLRYMKYNFAYDEQNRICSKIALKWDSNRNRWAPSFKISYQYAGEEVTMEYARWSDEDKAYEKATSKSVYELDDENIPVSYMEYERKANDKNWNEKVVNIFDNDKRLLATVK